MTAPDTNLTAETSAPKPVATATGQPGQPALSFADDPGTTALVHASPLDQPGHLSFQTAFSSQLPTVAPQPSKRPRNGKIADLPRPERDLVNRMLANNIPQHKIVAALDECGCHVTQRNVSNWKTRGGYKEWCAAQSQALELRTFQDNLTDFLQRHDAAELPEVGLQSAATNLSAILLRPDLMRELLADPQKYSKLIELQCRLAREIQALQKNRDEATRSVGFNPERLKRETDHDVESIRETYSSKIGKGPRDPNTPHRNYIPKETEPFVPITKTPSFDLIPYLRSRLPETRPSSSTPPASKSNAAGPA